MSNTNVVKIDGDTSGLNSALDKTSKSVSDLEKTAKQAQKAQEKFGESVNMSVSDLINEMNAMSKNIQSTTNYQRQLGALSKTIADLTINYGNLTDEQKKSADGMELAQKIDELKGKAAEWKDAIGDVQAEIKAMSSDTSGWDAFSQVVDVAGEAVRTFAGVAGLSEEETAKLTKTIVHLQTVQSAVATVTKLVNTLNKSSIAILKTKEIQTKAATIAENLSKKATEGNTVATIAATAAQKAFNVVAKANPYVMLAIAILAVGSAMYAFTSYLMDNTNEQDKNNRANEKRVKALEEEKKKMEDVDRSVGRLVSKYRNLQNEYSRLSSTADKQKWIENNASAFETLGVRIGNVKDAEDIFVNNTTNVVEAIMKRAKATALQNMLVEEYESMYAELGKIERRYRDEEEIRNQGTLDSYEKMLKDREKVTKEYTERIERLFKQVNDLTADADSVLGTPSKKNTPKKDPKTQAKEDDAHKKRLKELDDEAERLKAIQKIRTESFNPEFFNDMGYNGMVSNNTEGLKEEIWLWEHVRKTADEVAKKREEIAKIDPNNPAVKDAYNEFLILRDAEVSAKQELLKFYQTASGDAAKKFSDGIIDNFEYFKRLGGSIINAANIPVQIVPDDFNVKAFEDVLKNAKKELDDILNGMSRAEFKDIMPTLSEKDLKRYEELTFIVDTLQDSFENIKAVAFKPDAYKTKKELKRELQGGLAKEIQQILSDFNIGLIDEESAKKAVEELNKKLKSNGLKPIKVEIEPEVQQKGDAWGTWWSGADAFEGATSSVVNLTDSFKSLAEQWDDMDGWEQFTAMYDMFNNITSSVRQSIEAFSSFMDAMDTYKKVSNAVQAVEDTNTGKQVANATAKAAANSTETTSNFMKAVSEIFSAHSWIPFVGVPLALALVGTLVGAMVGASSKKFAGGGIVEGRTSVGDKISASLNKGEMVLNDAQQNRLWNMLNGTIPSGNNTIHGDVKFEIEGNKLVGVLKNHEKKQSKI